MNLGKKSVVVIDDEPETAELFAEMVRMMGYRAFKSSGGLQAVALIAEMTPAVVLMDVMMPELSGLDILRIMRREPRLARIPVVIVSAKGLPSDIRAGINAGAVSYLTKPIAFAELRAAVEKAVQMTDSQDGVS
jgi:CheY-like chemotaxis protein